jgi:hypothetical protein
VTRNIIGSRQILSTDIEVCVLDQPLPDSITPGPIFDMRLWNYLPRYRNADRNPPRVPVIRIQRGTSSVEPRPPQVCVADLYAQWVSYVSFIRPVDALRQAFYQDAISGDSSCPSGLVIGGKVYWLTAFTGGGGGSGPHWAAVFDQINAAIEAMLPGQGAQLTPTVPDGFPTL